VSDRNRRIASAANAKIARDRAEARERVITRVIRVTELSLARELEMLAAGNFTSEDLQALTNSRHKAIQQLELLEGRATTRDDHSLETFVPQVAAAFQSAVRQLPSSSRETVTVAFAEALRRVQDQFEHELDPGVEEAARHPPAL
jgi:hypothetical protein